MVSYGLVNDEDSFDTSFERPQPRKRTYPTAFPHHEEGQQTEVYNHPYRRTGPVGVEDSQEWAAPAGLSLQTVMECFTTALGWARYAMVEYGGKFFASGRGRFGGNVLTCSGFVDGEE